MVKLARFSLNVDGHTLGPASRGLHSSPAAAALPVLHGTLLTCLSSPEHPRSPSSHVSPESLGEISLGKVTLQFDRSMQTFLLLSGLLRSELSNCWQPRLPQNIPLPWVCLPVTSGR